jgi:hypothetical protein
MRKGELSIQFIVLAALALIFLVVVGMVLSGKVGIFNKTVGTCENSGGTCTTKSNCETNAGSSRDLGCDDGEVCCMNSCELSGGSCQSTCSGDESESWLMNCKSGGDVCCV